MAAPKQYRLVEDFLIEHGYTLDRINSKQTGIYTCPDRADVSLSLGIGDRQARQLIRTLQRDFGIPTAKDQSKRDALAVKERQAVERERAHQAAARSAAELEQLIRERDAVMDGLGSILGDQELDRVAALIEAKEKELRGWQQLMQSIPASGEHTGRASARHRS